MIRIPIIIASFILLFGCGFKPILTNKQLAYTISEIKYSGNEKINKYIKKNLITNSGSGKNYNLTFNSEKNIETLSNNQKGDPSVFQMSISVNYSVIYENNVILTENIKKKVTYNNIQDKFELSKFEENAVRNISNNISNEILISISRISK